MIIKICNLYSKYSIKVYYVSTIKILVKGNITYNAM